MINPGIDWFASAIFRVPCLIYWKPVAADPTEGCSCYLHTLFTLRLKNKPDGLYVFGSCFFCQIQNFKHLRINLNFLVAKARFSSKPKDFMLESKQIIKPKFKLVWLDPEICQRWQFLDCHQSCLSPKLFVQSTSQFLAIGKAWHICMTLFYFTIRVNIEFHVAILPFVRPFSPQYIHLLRKHQAHRLCRGLNLTWEIPILNRFAFSWVKHQLWGVIWVDLCNLSVPRGEGSHTAMVHPSVWPPMGRLTYM